MRCICYLSLERVKHPSAMSFHIHMRLSSVFYCLCIDGKGAIIIVGMYSYSNTLIGQVAGALILCVLYVCVCFVVPLCLSVDRVFIVSNRIPSKVLH